MQTDQEIFNELSYYTLSHRDPTFIHQYVVDAFTAQTANSTTKPIAIMFALAGLYLHREKRFTGRQVQRMHMNMAKMKKAWPAFDLPDKRGKITVRDVLSSPPGKNRDEMIEQWCTSVWDAYGENHAKVAGFMEYFLENDP